MSYSYHSQSWARQRIEAPVQANGWLGAMMQAFATLHRIRWSQPWNEQ